MRYICTSILATLALAGTTQAQPIQWTVAEGGNGHWYEGVVAGSPITWEQASLAAVAAGGHLVTITSENESEWLFQNIASNPKLWTDAIGPLIGAYQNLKSESYTEPEGGWQWASGEPWNYTNWQSGQPDNHDGDEHYAHYKTNWGESPLNQWNDLSTAPGTGAISYIVEYMDVLPNLTIHTLSTSYSAANNNSGSINVVSGRLEANCCQSEIYISHSEYGSYELEFEVGPVDLNVVFWKQHGGGVPNGTLKFYPCFDPLCGCVTDSCLETIPLPANGVEQTLQLAPGLYRLTGSGGGGSVQVRIGWSPSTTEPTTPIGACCITDQCIRTTSEFCQESGGVFAGADVSCDGTVCTDYPTSVGACCLSDFCLSTTLDDCYVANGIFAGFSTACDDEPCPLICNSDVTGDGEVAVNDILTVIANWGPCP